MRLPLNIYADGSVLAGSIEGQKVFADLLRKSGTPTTPEIYFLDFTAIDVATTSFLRDSVVAYKNHIRAERPTIYPVCANLTKRVREELESFLKMRGDAFVICALDTKGKVRDPELIGVIDGKQSIALQGVLKFGECDAPTLRDSMGEEVAATAWNNRLSLLASKGILIEVSRGRNKKFRPVLEGIQHGY